MKTTTKKTASAKTTPAPKTRVSGITPEVKVVEVDWEFQRRHQSKPFSREEVQELIQNLNRTIPEFTFQSISDRAYYGIKVIREGKTVAQYWAKKDFPRLVIRARVRDGISFPVDLTKRTALKPLERGSEELEEIEDEFVVTPAEALSVVRAFLSKTIPQSDAKKSEKPAEKPSEKPAEKKPAPKTPAKKSAKK